MKTKTYNRIFSILSVSALSWGLSLTASHAFVTAGAGFDGGDLIRPDGVIPHTTWPSNSPGVGEGSSDVTASNLIAPSGVTNGLSAESFTATHGASGGGSLFAQWHNNGTTTGWVMFDLGAAFNLSQVHIWNGNQLSVLGRGVQQFDILTSNTPGDYAAGQENSVSWTEVLTDGILTQGTGSSTLPADSFSLGGVNARYVQIRIDSNYGDAGGYTGLSEVRLSTVIPEPSAALLGTVAAFGLLLRRRRG